MLAPDTVWIVPLVSNRAEDSSWEVELVESSAATSSSLETRFKYLDALLTRSFIQPERTMLEGKHGTKAESGEQQDIALTMVEHRHGVVRQQLNEGPVADLCEAYLGPEWREAVHVEAEPIGADEKQFLRDILKQVLATPEGVMEMLDRIDFDQLREITGVPSLTEFESNDIEEVGTTIVEDEPVLPEEDPFSEEEPMNGPVEPVAEV